MADVNRILIEIVTVLRDKGFGDAKRQIEQLDRSQGGLARSSEQFAREQEARNARIAQSYSAVSTKVKDLEDAQAALQRKAARIPPRSTLGTDQNTLRDLERTTAALENLRKEQERLTRSTFLGPQQRVGGRFGTFATSATPLGQEVASTDVFNRLRDRAFANAVANLRKEIEKTADPAIRKRLQEEANALESFGVKAHNAGTDLQTLSRAGSLLQNSQISKIALDLENRFAAADRSIAAATTRLRNLGNDGSLIGRLRNLGRSIDFTSALSPSTVLGVDKSGQTRGRDLTTSDVASRGVFGVLRTVTRSDIFAKIATGTRDATKAQKEFGQELDRIDAKARRVASGGIHDLTQIDETVAIGFRRIARFMAVVVGILPIVTVAFGTLLAAATSLVGGITALGGALSTLVGFLAAVPTLAAAAGGALAAAFTVFKPAVTNITNAVHGILQQQKLQNQNQGKNQQAVQDAEARLADVRRTNAQQLRDLDEQIAQKRVTDVQQVRDAEEQLHHDRITHAEDEQDLRNRIRDQRIQNARQIRDAEEQLDNTFRDNLIQEKKLTESVMDARAGLAGLRLEGASALALAAQQARVDQAQTELQRFQATNILPSGANRARLERQINDPNFAEAQALRDQQKQVRNLNELKSDGAKQVKQLQTELARKIRDDNRDERNAEISIARLKKSNAQEEAQQLQQRQDLIIQNAQQERDAIQAVKAAQDTLTSGNRKDFLQGLSPQERGIAETILRIRDAWLKLTAATRNRFLNDVQAFFSFVEQRLPGIARLVDRFANVIINLWEKGFRNFTTGTNAGALNRIFSDGVPVLQDFGDALIKILDALVKIGDAGRPLARLLSKGLLDAATSIDRAVTRAATPPETTPLNSVLLRPEARQQLQQQQILGQQPQSGLDKFLGHTTQVGKLLTAALKNLGAALADVLRIAEPFGEKILADFVGWTQRVLDFVRSQHGKDSLTSFFADATPVFEDLIKLGGDLVKTLFNIGRELIRPGDQGQQSFLERIVDGLDKALPSFQKFVVESTRRNGPALIRFIRELGSAIGILVGPGGVFVKLLDLLGGFIGFINKIGSLPGGRDLLKLLFAFLTLGPLINQVSRNLKSLLFLVGRFSETGSLPLIGKLVGSIFLRWVFLAAVLFGSMNKLKSVINLLLVPLRALADVVSAVGRALDWTGQLVGIDNTSRVLSAVFVPALLAANGNVFKLFQGLSKAVGALKAFAALSASEGFLAALGAQFPRIVGAISKIGPALAKARAAIVAFSATSVASIRAVGLALVTPPVGIVVAIAAVVAALVVLELKFHIFERLYHIIVDFATRAINFLKAHWQEALVLVLTGPIGLIIFELRDKLYKLGRDIVFGILNGIKSLGTSIKDFLVDKFKSAIDGAKHFLHIGSPSRLTYDELGVPFAQGIVNGVFDGLTPLGATVERAMDVALQRAQNKVDQARTTMVQSFSDLQNAVNASFDEKLDFSKHPTAAGRQLAALDRQDTLRQQRQEVQSNLQAVREARAKLDKDAGRLQTGSPLGRGRFTTTRGGGADPKAVAADKKALRDAENQLKETRRQIAEDQLRARLQIEDQQEQESRTKRVQAEQTTANAMVQKFIDVLSDPHSTLPKIRAAQAALTNELTKLGITGPQIDRAVALMTAFRKALVKAALVTKDEQLRIIRSFFPQLKIDDKGRATGVVFGPTIGGGTPPTKATPGGTAAHQASGGTRRAQGDTPESFVARLSQKEEKDLVDYLAVHDIQQRTIRRDFANGMSYEDILLDILRHGYIGIVKMKQYAHLAGIPGFDVGGTVPGRLGAPVPILAHGGEWVLNEMQKRKAAALAGVSPIVLERALFQDAVSVRNEFFNGGVVRGGGGATVNAPITVNTTSPLDPNYLARVLEARMRSVA